MSNTLHIVSLGCPKNRVDSEVMLGILDREGYQLVDDPAEARVILVNTCAFIGPAKEESVRTVLEMARLKETGACDTLVVTGCLTQRYPTELAAEMPEVDHFVGTGAYHEIAEVLRGKRARSVIPDPDFVYTAETPRIASLARWSTYLKISEGCDNTCSFCIIPTLRGGQKSRPIADLVAEAERHAQAGVLELNLIAQDLTAYGYDLPGRPHLADLLTELAKVPLRWIRLHYAYPRAFPDRLIELIGREERIVPYLDMPLQHASDRILRSMRRGRDVAWVRALLGKLRDRVPGLTLRTTFIVGFPGETDDDFRQLCDFIEEQRFERAGVFEFSREEGTSSYDLPDQIPQGIKAKRRAKLLGIQRKISKAHQRAMVGRTIDVLVEGASPETEHLLIGRHAGQAPDIDGCVYLNDGEAQPGMIVPVEITQAGDYDLVGRVAGPAKAISAPGAAPRSPRAALRVLGAEIAR